MLLGIHCVKGTFLHNVIAIIAHLSHTSDEGRL
jgi:hypothetical protein